jgi:hypothetical protein
MSTIFKFRYNASTADFDAPSGYSSAVAFNGTLNNQSSYSWIPPPGWASADVLVVAGGGAGGGNRGGGGGAGGAFITSNVTLSGSLLIVVGEGGLKGSSAGSGNSNGGNGNNSSFGGTIASGGGGGAWANVNANNGGSGGGSGHRTSTTLFLGGEGVVGQGYKGGNQLIIGGNDHALSSGGGGAGEPGFTYSSTNSGNGGKGILFNGTFYGGGGGGGAGTLSFPSAVVGIGGQGGGGNGGYSTASGNIGPGVGGQAHTGGGGGGGGQESTGGDGGSGVVIIKFISAKSFPTIGPLTFSTIRNLLNGQASVGTISVSQAVQKISNGPFVGQSVNLQTFLNRKFVPELGNLWAKIGSLDAVLQKPIAAYSFRCLFASYSGPQVRVRRSTDNLETDVTFDTFGKVYKISSGTWSSWSLGQTICITKWYDQSGGGNNYVQSTTTLQPIMVYNSIDDAYVISFNGESVLGISSRLNLLDTFAFRMKARPSRAIEIDKIQTNSSASDLAPGNKVLGADQANSQGYGANSAALGLNLGTNGVMTLNHSDSYYNRPLVQYINLSDKVIDLVINHSNRTPSLYVSKIFTSTGLMASRTQIYFFPGNIGKGVYGTYQGQVHEFIVWNQALNSTSIQSLQ